MNVNLNIHLNAIKYLGVSSLFVKIKRLCDARSDSVYSIITETIAMGEPQLPIKTSVGGYHAAITP
jgi:hypothetical protein